MTLKMHPLNAGGLRDGNLPPRATPRLRCWILGCCVTKFAPRKTLKSIACCKLTFDERVIPHSVISGRRWGRLQLECFQLTKPRSFCNRAGTIRTRKPSASSTALGFRVPFCKVLGALDRKSRNAGGVCDGDLPPRAAPRLYFR